MPDTKKKIDVSVIIINYNTFELTRKCISSLKKWTSGISYEIILVDNASSECNPQLFKNEFPDLILIESNTNLGFSKGNNLGIQYANGEYILLLNSDTEFLENTLKKTMDAIKLKNKKIGFTGVKTIYPDGSFQHTAGRLPTIKSTLIYLFGIHKIFKSIRIYDKPDRDFYPEILYGSFLIFHKSLLSHFKNNKLNESFFMYFEDCLWCWEAKKAGYKNFYFTGTQIIHHGGGSQLIETTKQKMNKEFSLNKIRYPKIVNGPLGYPFYVFFKKILNLRIKIRSLFR